MGEVTFFLTPERTQDAIPYVRTKMEHCYTQDRSAQCYKSTAIDFLNHFSLKEILLVFEENETRQEFFNNCHGVAHYLGQESYRRTKSIRKVFANSSRACLGGTYHGAVEGYFMEKKIDFNDDASISREVGILCGSQKDYKRIQEFTECYHGLGHATMFITDNELPRALMLCDGILVHGERVLCYTGVFMANADSLNNVDHPSEFLKEDDPLYPCPILKEQYQRMCYTYGTLSRFQYDLSTSIEICERIPRKYQNECFETLGHDRTMVSADENELKDQCAQIKDTTSRDYCIRGVAYNLVVRFGTQSFLPFSFCSLIASESTHSCFERVNNAFQINASAYPEEFTAQCNKILDKENNAICTGLIK